MNRRLLLILTIVGLLFACGQSGSEIHEFQIVVNGSTTPDPVNFTGSYACRDAGEQRTVDISGSGTLTTSFQCEQLLHVRIQRVLGVGLVSLTVYRDGQDVFSTPPTDSVAPIVYVPQTEPH